MVFASVRVHLLCERSFGSVAFSSIWFVTMAALEAAAQVKMQAAVEERSLKQSGRFRLVADPSIPVTAIQGALTGFLQFKQKKDLWSLICPPPTGPMSYGWHTAPHGERLSKVAGLLF